MPLAELFLGKQRILEIYLNVVEQGPGIYGANAACHDYDGTAARNIDRQQAARLAAILPAPLRAHESVERAHPGANATNGLVMGAPGYQKNLLPLSTRPKNRTTVEVSIHTSAPSCHDGPAWPCTGAFYPCICRQPPEKHQRLSA